MINQNTFASWLANLLGQSDESQVSILLENKQALHFLIAWSLFESKCFHGFVRQNSIDDFSKKVAQFPIAGLENLHVAGEHFHDRYQDKKRLHNLLHNGHENQLNPLSMILKKQFSDISQEELVFLNVFVTYRFRNNMFHGNKGIHSWVRFEKQISLCTKVLQTLVSREMKMNPTMIFSEST